MSTVIGISGNIIYENSKISNKMFVNETYTEAVYKSEAIAFIIPMTDNKTMLKKSIEKIDGLILTGGVDVHPFYFNEEPHQKIGEINKDRDEFDLLIIKYAVEMKKPILAICRGMQILNVYFGGSIIQDIPSQVEKSILHSQTAPINVATHKIKIEKNSFIYKILGEESEVNSFHHQAVKQVANDFVVTAKSSDGIIEAMEYKNMNEHFILALQWHPEAMAFNNIKMQNIFNMFSQICSR